MKFSIVLNTNQELNPMHDFDQDIFSFLADSLENQTLRDFELIIIDRKYEERIGLFKRMNLSSRFPWKYCPTKPSPWYEVDPGATTISNDRNAGIFLSRGEIVMIMDDCVALGNKWLLQQVWDRYKEGHLLRPLFHFYTYNKPPYPRFKRDPLYNWLKDQEKKDYHEVSGNCARVHLFPVKIFEDLNGFDERLDGAWGNIDCNWNERVDANGIKRYIMGYGQHPFEMVGHGHRLRKITNLTGYVCNECYVHWTYKQIRGEADKHTSNDFLITEEDIEIMKKICTDECPTRERGGCKKDLPQGLDYYLHFQPRFSVAAERKRMIDKCGDINGAFNPW